MAIDMKQTNVESTSALTARDVMDSNCLIIPQQMLVREAARQLHRKRSHMAAVVDSDGRCAGVLRAADVFRWIEANCPNVVIGAGLACPYQVRGRLLNGNQAVICTLAHGSCTFQVDQPTTGGRRTDVCARQETDAPPVGKIPRYMTSHYVSISPQATLTEMVQHIVDTRLDGLVVLDKFNRPSGIVSATDILIAMVGRLREGVTVSKEQITATARTLK